MGRGHESEVRVNDISVSRCHALLKYAASNEATNGVGGFYMEDNLSKFGTLVLAKSKEIVLEPEMTKAVQIGRSVISFTVKESAPDATIEKSPPPRVAIENQIDSSSSKTLNIKPIQVEAAAGSETGDIEAILKEKIEKTNEKIQQLMKEQAERVEKARREYVA